MNSCTEDLDKLIISYKSCKDDKKRLMIYLNIVDDAMSYVKKIANSIACKSGVSNEDLIQVGSLGLIKAIESFDPKHNAKFKTYATYFIKGEIKHYLRDKAGIIKAPRELQELVSKISSTIEELYKNGVENPSSDDIAKVLNIDVDKIENVLNIEKYKTVISLDQYLKGDEEDFSLLDKIPSGDYEEIMNSYENKIMLEEAIRKLPEELKQIIELCYYYDMSQREISEKLNLSQMQVSRRLKKALNMLYEIIGRSIL